MAQIVRDRNRPALALQGNRVKEQTRNPILELDPLGLAQVEAAMGHATNG
jgi:hypothetical protein